MNRRLLAAIALLCVYSYERLLPRDGPLGPGPLRAALLYEVDDLGEYTKDQLAAITDYHLDDLVVDAGGEFRRWDDDTQEGPEWALEAIRVARSDPRFGALDPETNKPSPWVVVSGSGGYSGPLVDAAQVRRLLNQHRR